ncbi:uncharacterized protein TNCV_2613611 [Trichonephila clavipes]|nr:uncharacterized protein TNCV_2613611 [Trichonephila clavipes]
MSDHSDNIEFSPTRQTQVAACEKLRDTVTGISALHMSLQDGRSPSPKNSFTELYRMSTQAMIKRKEEMVSELKTLPPCTRSDCNEHKIPTTSIVEEINLKVPSPELKTNRKGNKKKLSKKRKNKGKESTEEFIFPKKTARPVSPTSTQDPIETSNNFSDLEQDVEHPLPTANQVTTEVVTPKITLPHPIMLKIKKNFREQIQCFNCNNFYHTAANCFMKPRCLKCGKEHATKNCRIKERLINPFCINCQDFGHSACYTKCPKFPQPRKKPPLQTQLKRKISSVNGPKRKFPSLTLLAGKSPVKPSRK